MLLPEQPAKIAGIIKAVDTTAAAFKGWANRVKNPVTFMKSSPHDQTLFLGTDSIPEVAAVGTALGTI
ncbi:MAG: hypothetical protein OHK0012_10760 [Synechococcales cyanobacterium]